jgi:hypothetical protein
MQFNRGASIDDIIAVGQDQEPLALWKERHKIEVETQIKLVKLSHMRYQHPDLNEITTFLQGTSTQQGGEEDKLNTA